MAEFRRCLYALAFVVLLAGLVMPASAQSMNCSTTSVPTNARAEGYAELMGDIIITCTGGVPTPAGAAVPRVNITVNLDTFVTSKTTAVVNGNTEFLESLLIVDEPNSALWATPNPGPQHLIRNCGAASEDRTTVGPTPGVCAILGGGYPLASATYDGSCPQPDPTIAGYNCHPNVFQGRSLRLITGQTNQVVFVGIPIDPPGTVCPNQPTFQPNCQRIFRITNIRGDASQTGVAQGNQTSTITAQVISDSFSVLPVSDTARAVARVQLGLVTPSLKNGNVAGGKFDFIQCKELQDQSQNQHLTFTFREAFQSSFKPRSLRQVLNNGTVSSSPSFQYTYTGLLAPNVSTAVSLNQNVPGAPYFTESGYVNVNGTAGGNPPTNPLSAGAGSGNAFVDTTNAPGSTTSTDPITGAPNGFGTGITQAGIATQGTRLIMNFTNVPTGSSIMVPRVINLTDIITGNITGVAVLVTGTSAAGSGYPIGFGITGSVVVDGTAVSPFALVAGSQIPGGVGPVAQRAVYEIFFSDPFSLEQLAVPMTVLSTCSLGNAPTTPCPNLPGNVPPPGTVAKIQGGFAPFYAPALNVRTTALEGSGAPPFGTEDLSTTPARLPVPRFQNLNAPVDLFAVVKCSCNLLFPFVTNAPTAGGNFDTGIAISNTSLDPGNLPPTAFGFRASAQSGPVQLWYYNRNATPAVEPNFLQQGNTQCTNQATPGSCSGALANVAPGGQLTYVLSSGGVINGQTPAGPVLLGAPAFTGYIIAQAGFQYCHGFAFISRQGAGFDATNMAMGYLAIVLDEPGLPRTFSVGENDGH